VLRRYNADDTGEPFSSSLHAAIFGCALAFAASAIVSEWWLGCCAVNIYYSGKYKSFKINVLDVGTQIA
jgi:hypothetical protein